MELIKEFWLPIAVGVYLLFSILYGHYQGMLRKVVTLAALIASLIFVRTAMPYVTGFLKENTQIHQAIGQGLLNLAGIEDSQKDEKVQMPAQQRAIIENMKIPEQMKETLLENNNNEIYRLLGVDAFFDYMGTSLANMVLNIIGSVILFILSFVVIRILLCALDVVSHLPVLYGINQIAGAILGGVQGLLVVWMLGLVVNACASSAWAQQVIIQIDKSLWLSFLYHNNLINWILLRALKGFV